MDLFKINQFLYMRNGEAINNWDRASWVERYRDPGEFEIAGRLSSGLREFLPLGTLISHTNTLEVMIVENHQVTEETDVDPEITITGRSFECYLEQRVVGQNQNWTTPPANVPNYTLTADYTWFQAIQLVNDHIALGPALADDVLDYVVSDTFITGTGVNEARTIKRGNVHQRLIELLEIDDLGVKISRAHTFDEPFPGLYTIIQIYNGEDRRDLVRFSAQTGDITTADYLWSDKKFKNAALVSGKFVETMVYGTETGYERRVMLVDANDIDGSLQDIPTGTDLTDIREVMAVRGRQALTAQKRIVLSRADISENASYQYRKDYNVGDIVTIDGNFGESMPMRVVEYAEIVDENGQSGQPTLSVLES